MKKELIKILSAVALTTFFANDILTTMPFANDGTITPSESDVSITEPLLKEDEQDTATPNTDIENESPNDAKPIDSTDIDNINPEIPNTEPTTPEVPDAEKPTKEEPTTENPAAEDPAAEDPESECIPVTEWEGNEALIKEVLTKTGIDDISKVTYKDIKTIESIDISGTSYPIPNILGKFVGLKDLNIANTGLSEFPNALSSLPLLTNLNVSNNNLITTPEYIVNNVNLNLDVSYNQIYSLPEVHSANIIFTHTFLPSESPYQLMLAADSWVNLSNNRFLTQSELKNAVEVSVAENQLEELDSRINLVLFINDKEVAPEDLSSFDKGTYTAYIKIQGSDASNSNAMTDHSITINIEKPSETETGAVPYEAWEDCTPLIDFTCNYLKISDIKSVTYEDLATIEYIELLNKNLNSLPSIVSKYTNVQTINLVNNNFTEIPDEIFSLKNLTDINMSNNMVTAIPDGIGDLANLEMLTLENNNISSISSKISNLSKLKYLCLNSNKQLQNCLETIYNINSLETLFMHNCDLYTLGDNISKLTNLKILQVCGNQLITTPNQGKEFTNYTDNFISPNTSSYKQLTLGGESINPYKKESILSQAFLRDLVFAAVNTGRGMEFEALNPNHVIEFIVDDKVVTGEELSKYPNGTYEAHLIIKGADINNTAAITKDAITINISGNDATATPTKPSENNNNKTPNNDNNTKVNSTTPKSPKKDITKVKTSKKGIPYTGSEIAIILTLLGSLSIGSGALIFKNRKNKKH